MSTRKRQEHAEISPISFAGGHMEIKTQFWWKLVDLHTTN